MKYTDDEVAILIEMYNAGQTIDSISTVLDRSDRSVRCKLVALGLYFKRPYTDKNGNIPKKKEEYVREISAYLGVPEEFAESLEKCNKNILHLILEKLK